ncbi:hypothetical protein D3C86_1853260 [compost metagenome]
MIHGVSQTTIPEKRAACMIGETFELTCVRSLIARKAPRASPRLRESWLLTSGLYISMQNKKRDS